MKPFPPITGFQDTQAYEPEVIDTIFHDARGVETVVELVDPRELIKTRYPRIFRQIDFLWGSKELQNRFTRWLITDQEGRKGWPKGVYVALQQLSTEHQEKFGFEPEIKFDGIRDKW